MTEERVGQVRGPTDPIDPTGGLLDHFTKGQTGKASGLDGIQAGPQRLDRLDVGRVDRLALSNQPVLQQGGLLPTEEAPHLDKRGGVGVAEVDAKAELDAVASAWRTPTANSHEARSRRACCRSRCRWATGQRRTVGIGVFCPARRATPPPPQRLQANPQDQLYITSARRSYGPFCQAR